MGSASASASTPLEQHILVDNMILARGKSRIFQTRRVTQLAR